MSEAVDDLLARLEGVRRSGDGWVARCSAHEDRHPSLSITEGSDGRALIHCHAGCSTEAVVNALGLSMRDLFDGEGGSSVSPRGRATVQRPGVARSQRAGNGQEPPPLPSSADGLTVDRYAEAKGLDPDLLRRWGASDIHFSSRQVVKFSYRDESGAEIGARFRHTLSEEEGPRFSWRKGSTAQLYGQEQLVAARAEGRVLLVEGESDCHTAWQAGVPAVGLPGAAMWREDRDVALLEGVEVIYVVVEPDAGGEAVMRWLDKSAIRDRVRLVRLDGHEDISAMYLADPSTFCRNLEVSMASAVLYPDRAAEEAELIRAEAWALCADLAQEPRILECLETDLNRSGHVGETRTSQIIYLAMISTLLAWIISLAVKGPSSAGKSFTVDTALGFFPPRAYYKLSGMSERALAYGSEPLDHRTLVFAEAAGMSGEFASYLTRSLLSEGQLRYETTEKVDGSFETRVIVRDGPTGLIITTTELALHPENETRLLSLSVTDTPEQTKAVMLATAKERRDPVDVTTWHALYVWLGTGPCVVTIPFAEALAEAIPPVSLRLRRDFKQLLSLIRAHALLHRATRELDDEGRVIATLEDYAVVRDLVHDLFSEGVGASVPAIVRETVEAIPDMVKNMTVNEVAAELGIDKSAASRRVKQAIAHGYLINDDGRPGRPALLRRGSRLPDEQVILPRPEKLIGCTTTGPDGIPPPADDPITEDVIAGLVERMPDLADWSPELLREKAAEMLAAEARLRDQA